MWVTGSVSWLTQAPGALSNGPQHLPSGSLFGVANSYHDFSASMWINKIKKNACFKWEPCLLSLPDKRIKKIQLNICFFTALILFGPFWTMRPKFRQVGNFPFPPPARIPASEPGASPPRRPGRFPPAGLRPGLSSPDHRKYYSCYPVLLCRKS